MSDSNFDGVATEILFEYDATRYGLIVSRPSYPAKYDRVVDNGSNLHRVQIKHINNTDEDNLYSCKKMWKYTYNSIDFIAIHLPRESSWFIIPAAIIPANTIKISTSLHSKYSAYFNAWYLLTNVYKYYPS